MKQIFVFFLVVISLNVKGQNMVMNPSFEDTIPWSTLYPLQLNGFKGQPAAPWYRPTNGTPDYFSEVYNGNSQLPSNGFGFTYARTGLACVGVGVYHYPFNPDYREYTTGVFSDSLIANRTYNISFYVKPGSKCKFVTDDISAYISIDSNSNYTINTNLLVMPQIENSQGNILNDTVNWTLVTGPYTAVGGEKYITIGSFKDDVNTTLDSFPGTFGTLISYYFIDDISVVDITGTSINEPGNIAMTFQNPVASTLRLNTIQDVEEVILYNTIGMEVARKIFNRHNEVYEFAVGHLPAGMYVIKIKSKMTGYFIKSFLKI